MQHKNAVSGILAVLLIVGLAGQAFSGDAGRILRSSVCPGMGQLGDGMGEITHPSTIKGLGFLTVEVVCLSMMFSELSHKNSSARETAYLEAEYRMASTYEQRAETFQNWQEAFDKSGRSNLMMMAYGGAAAVVWGLNIVDIVAFKPKDAGESSIINTIRNNTLLAFNGEKALLKYTVTF
jgi:hypothetical protein